MTSSEELINRLNANATRQCFILHWRPPKPENGYPYEWDSRIFFNQTKLWKQVNRLQNWHYEWEKTELNLPTKYFPSEKIL